MPPNAPEHTEGKEEFSQQIEKSIDDRIREFQTIDQKKGEALQQLKSAIVEKIVMPKLDDRGQVTGSKIDDLRLDEGEMGQVFDLLQKDPTVKGLLDQSGLKTPEDLMALLGLNELSSNKLGLQKGPTTINEDTNIFSANGKMLGVIFRGETAQITDATQKMIKGQPHILAAVTHDLGRYRSKYAGKTKNYTGYIPVSSLQGNASLSAAPEPVEPPSVVEPVPTPTPEPSLAAPEPVTTPSPETDSIPAVDPAPEPLAPLPPEPVLEPLPTDDSASEPDSASPPAPETSESLENSEAYQSIAQALKNSAASYTGTLRLVATKSGPTESRYNIVHFKPDGSPTVIKEVAFTNKSDGIYITGLGGAEFPPNAYTIATTYFTIRLRKEGDKPKAEPGPAPDPLPLEPLSPNDSTSEPDTSPAPDAPPALEPPPAPEAPPSPEPPPAEPASLEAPASKDLLELCTPQIASIGQKIIDGLQPQLPAKYRINPVNTMAPAVKNKLFLRIENKNDSTEANWIIGIYASSGRISIKFDDKTSGGNSKEFTSNDINAAVQHCINAASAQTPEPAKPEPPPDAPPAPEPEETDKPKVYSNPAKPFITNLPEDGQWHPSSEVTNGNDPNVAKHPEIHYMFDKGELYAKATGERYGQKGIVEVTLKWQKDSEKWEEIKTEIYEIKVNWQEAYEFVLDDIMREADKKNTAPDAFDNFVQTYLHQDLVNFYKAPIEKSGHTEEQFRQEAVSRYEARNRAQGEPSPAPQPAGPAEKAPTQSEAVETEKNNIIPRYANGDSSDNPRCSFDATQIPTTLTIRTGAEVFSGKTPEGRNAIAKRNIIIAANEAQIRARILQSTGKLPEQFSAELEDRRALLRARADAQTDLMNWTVSPDIIAKYLVKDDTASPEPSPSPEPPIEAPAAADTSVDAADFARLAADAAECLDSGALTEKGRENLAIINRPTGDFLRVMFRFPPQLNAPITEQQFVAQLIKLKDPNDPLYRNPGPT